ncbi:hypothetical protein M9Y10_039089 [Tritrichomonas musculus]|uniref:Uncharacterized protein n=1 Tax=Tritrichomonas musculus TaxID=1915356 RepID=A0ABR2KA84_9EUKA
MSDKLTEEDQMSVNGLWEKYENALSHIYELDRKNQDLGAKAHNDSMRVNFFNLEENTKHSDHDNSIRKLQESNEFFADLSKLLDKIEESASAAHIKEINAFFHDVLGIKPRGQKQMATHFSTS